MAHDRIWQPDEILSRYRRGERDFSGLEIAEPPGGPSFSSAILREADFSHAIISASFDDADLTQVLSLIHI